MLPSEGSYPCCEPGIHASYTIGEAMSQIPPSVPPPDARCFSVLDSVARPVVAALWRCRGPAPAKFARCCRQVRSAFLEGPFRLRSPTTHRSL